MHVVVAFTNRDLGAPGGWIGRSDKFGGREERLVRVSGQIFLENLLGQRKSGKKSRKFVWTQNTNFGFFEI